MNVSKCSFLLMLGGLSNCGGGAQAPDAAGMGEGSGLMVTATVGAAETETESESGDDVDPGTPAKTDIGSADPDAEVSNCQSVGGGGPGAGGSGGGLGVDFAYAWISNSGEGTISKVNTDTLVEEGRYQTREDGNGRPSRSSVNLNGDVAVANRDGGVTFIRARTDDCQDPANTSSGPDDVKDWMDGCIEWVIPAEDYSVQRPMAFTAGEQNPQTCRYENIKLWNARARPFGEIEIILIDGETGVVEEVIPTGVVSDSYGMYGGAVDSEGNFWGTMLHGTTLFHVRLDDLQLQTFPAERAYGIAVDINDRVWACSSSISRFDPMTGTWETATLPTGTNDIAGCMADANGMLWASGANNTLLAINIDTMELEREFPLPGFAKGICTGFSDDVWAVSSGSEAYRVNMMTGATSTVAGFNGLYTYSDCIGGALSAVTPPSAAG